jgi:MerR family transcriptional regulator, redox-sensitive transcriptional activator SoxR
MAMLASDRLPIGELSRRTGIAVSAIRYYEEQGLIASERNAGGQRRFRRSDIRRLSFVLIAQQFGFTLPQIRDVLDRLPDGRTPNKADWTRIGETFRAELDRKIGTLTELRNRLDKCVGCGCLSLTDCTLYNPEDRAGKKGAGPRYLMGDKPEAG